MNPSGEHFDYLGMPRLATKSSRKPPSLAVLELTSVNMKGTLRTEHALFSTLWFIGQVNTHNGPENDTAVHKRFTSSPSNWRGVELVYVDVHKTDDF
jgi:hypothetical protein